MIVIETIAVAFSMYSALPMPQFAWNSRNMKYALCAFPLIGLVIGGAELLITAIGQALPLPPLLMAALLCLCPVALTGGIHLDGYCDTCDALASHAAPEKKQEILKDPHIGSFAVIRLVSYQLFSFALWASLLRVSPVPILLLFVLSRTMSGLAVCSFPLAKSSGLAYLFAEAADKKNVRRILLFILTICCVGLIALGGMEGAAALLAAGLTFADYYRVARKHFGGLSGDLAGWFLQRCELWMLLAICAVQFFEGI